MKKKKINGMTMNACVRVKEGGLKPEECCWKEIRKAGEL